MVFLSAFLPLLALYLGTLSPTVPLEDGGEMIREAFALGLTHPPGYPLYLLVGRLAMALPLGDPAFRMNLLSALSGAAAGGVLAVACFRVVGGLWGRTGPAAVASVFAALLLGTGYSAWWQSVIAEKYAFNLLLASGCVAALANALYGESSSGTVPMGRRAVLLGLAYGLWFGHHGQAVFFLPVVLYAAWRVLKGSGLPGRILVFASLMFLAGISAKLLYTPIRGMAHSLHGWGSATALGGFLEYSVGAPYQWRSFYWGWGEAARRFVVHAVAFIPHQFGWAGALLAVYGFIRLAARSPWDAAGWGGAALFGWTFCAFFYLQGGAIETYLMPVFVLLAVFIASGAAGAAKLILPLPRPARSAFVMALVALVGANAGTHLRSASRDRNYFPYDFTRNVLASVPPDSFLLVYGDREMFPHWYVHDILGYSPSVILADAWVKMEAGSGGPRAGRIRLEFPPDRRDLQARYPYAGDLIAGNPGRPVFMSGVLPGVERLSFFPRGAAYGIAKDRVAVKKAETEDEQRRFPGRMRWRGFFSVDIGKDEHTQMLLGAYIRSYYWRGYLKVIEGRERDAIGYYRRALSMPRFAGGDPAALHGALGWCLEKTGDGEGAAKEYEEAFRLEPGRTNLAKSLGFFYLKSGRTSEAAAVFRKAVEQNPADRELRDILMRLQLTGGAR
jgi:hypothetical protein